MENYLDFEKLARVIQHSLQGLIIVKNIEGEPVNRGNLSQSYFAEMGRLRKYPGVNNSKRWHPFCRIKPWKRHLKPSHR